MRGASLNGRQDTPEVPKNESELTQGYQTPHRHSGSPSCQQFPHACHTPAPTESHVSVEVKGTACPLHPSHRTSAVPRLRAQQHIQAAAQMPRDTSTEKHPPGRSRTCATMASKTAPARSGPHLHSSASSIACTLWLGTRAFNGALPPDGRPPGTTASSSSSASESSGANSYTHTGECDHLHSACIRAPHALEEPHRGNAHDVVGSANGGHPFSRDALSWEKRSHPAAATAKTRALVCSSGTHTSDWRTAGLVQSPAKIGHTSDTRLTTWLNQLCGHTTVLQRTWSACRRSASLLFSW